MMPFVVYIVTLLHLLLFLPPTTVAHHYHLATMEGTSDNQPNVPEDNEPESPQYRRMTRGMWAAGGVIPPVAAPVKKKRGRKPKPANIIVEAPGDDDDHPSQGAASARLQKGE